MGDGVIVVNASQVKVSGNKASKDEHTYYTGFPGGLRHVKLADHLKDNPVEVLQLAVRRMLPKNRLGAQMMKRLKVYRDSTHPHVAQKPEATKVSTK
jgi:large subunit ribosomal protein L13